MSIQPPGAGGSSSQSRRYSPTTPSTGSFHDAPPRGPRSAFTGAYPAPRLSGTLCNISKGQHTATWAPNGFHWSVGDARLYHLRYPQQYTQKDGTPLHEVLQWMWEMGGPEHTTVGVGRGRRSGVPSLAHVAVGAVRRRSGHTPAEAGRDPCGAMLHLSLSATAIPKQSQSQNVVKHRTCILAKYVSQPTLLSKAVRLLRRH